MSWMRTADASDVAMLSLTPDPAAPSHARAWAASLLTGWPPERIHNACLVVSELVANAVLHAHTPIVVRCETRPSNARFEVLDGSHGTPSMKRYALDSPTGHGMRLIGMLVDEWGVSDLPNGKSVWCVVSARGRRPRMAPITASGSADPGTRGHFGDESGASSDDSTLVTSGSPEVDLSGSAEPSDSIRVRILGLPVSVYLEAEEHNDAVMRELTLIVQSADTPAGREVPRRLLILARGVLEAFNRATPALRAQVDLALARGQATVDIEALVRVEGWERLMDLAAQLDELDRYCEEGDMLTLASSPTLRRFRRWYADQVGNQMRGLPPTPWDEGDDLSGGASGSASHEGAGTSP
jgi:anti-sigma regulatory factor (Ser/Thr protein kinase)